MSHLSGFSFMGFMSVMAFMVKLFDERNISALDTRVVPQDGERT